MQNNVLIARLRNGEQWILSRDGWNPGSEMVAWGRPLWREDATEWTLHLDEVIAYRYPTSRERHSWENKDRLRDWLRVQESIQV